MQAGPTAKQFAALKKQVAALQKTVKTNQSHLKSLAVAYVHCSLHSEIEIAERGVDGLYGYSYTDGPTGFTTALDILRAGSVAPAYPLTLYNDVDPACRHLVGLPLRHNTGSVFAQKFT
jgi:hypothetical protein